MKCWYIIRYTGSISVVAYPRSWSTTYTTTALREYLSTGYGMRFSTEIYGSKREKTVFHQDLQEACFVLTEISENLRRPPGVYWRM